MGLFRSEVIDAQRERLQGQVVVLPRWPHTLVCGFLLLWVIAVAVFLTQGSYSRKETVRGWLEPADGLVQVFAQSEGRLARLLVAPGDTVVAGQPLAVINGDRVLEDGAHLESILLAEYRQQKAVLERQLARNARLSDLREREVEGALGDAEAALLAIDSQLTTLSERVALTRKKMRRHHQLAEQGHITASELDTLREQALILEGEHQASIAARIEQQSRVQSLHSKLARLPGEADDAMDRLRLSVSELSQQIAKLRGNRAYVVQAPVAGSVSHLGFQPGQRVRHGQPLATLLPQGSPLVAQLLVPVQASGFLSAGQTILIRYDAFPYQKYGLHPGELVSVSDSALAPGELAHLPLSASVPVFRASARPGQRILDIRGTQHALRAGMTFSADIVLEQRSLLQWLLEPLYSLRGKFV